MIAENNKGKKRKNNRKKESSKNFRDKYQKYSLKVFISKR